MIPLGLPEPVDWIEADVVANIRDHRWHVCLVHAGECAYCAEEGHDQAHDHDEDWRSGIPECDTAYEAGFAYTVGLTPRYDHPELIVVGGWSGSGHFLNAAGNLVAAGRRLVPGDTSGEVLPDFVVRFGPVGPRSSTTLLALAHWAVHRQPFEALQLVLPDRWGRWPEDPAYHGYPQSALTP